MEEYKILRIESKNIQTEYKLSNRKIRKLNECDLRFGFDYAVKTDTHHILVNLSRTNG